MPAAVMEEAHLSIDQAIEVRVEAGRIVIEPVAAQEFSLEDMLAQITPENMHGEVSFGPPRGREAL
jgi:antitoxin MazE